jgi:hypothetical protein
VSPKATIGANWSEGDNLLEELQRSTHITAVGGPSRDLGDHAALARAGSASAIRSNRCPNPAPSVPL